MTSKGGIVGSVPPRSSTTRRGFDATSVDTHPSSDGATGGPCRFCGAELRHTFVDLGMSPLCESYLRSDQLDAMERFYPLHVLVCDRCFLVQLKAYVSGEEIFGDYAYFSSYS
ncbi:MAG: class I SAM-dependent methyltransferase, partial [Acidimicrobiales bacterium]